MTKKKMSSAGIITLIAGILLLLTTICVNVTWFDYWHGNVELRYDAKIDQCNDALVSHYDVTEDAINYERTTTDERNFDSSYNIEECKLLTKNPERFLRGTYGSFWAGYIVMNLLALLLETLGLFLLYVMCDDLIY